MTLNFNVGIKAVIVKDDKILLLHKRSKDLWEGPGGKMDGDESTEETLVRELREELPGIKNIQVGTLLNAQRLPGKVLGDNALFLVWYKVEADFPEGVSISDEHDDFGWFSVEAAVEKASDGIIEAIGRL